MAIQSCRRCNKLFNSLGRPLCPNCYDEMDNNFVTVRDYLYDNPSVNVDTVSKETEVPLKDILSLIREGRIIMGSAEASGLRCKTCGRAIVTGTMCDKCSANLSRQMMSVSTGTAKANGDDAKSKKAPDLGKKTSIGMHIDIKKGR